MSRRDAVPAGPTTDEATGGDAGRDPDHEAAGEVASVARVYDYALGGKDNYAVDREMFTRIIGVFPGYPAWARANREFMIGAVRQMAVAGVTQFLDLGTGIPTSPNVHEIAREVVPQARVVYVDNDPVVLAHNRALLRPPGGVVAIEADIRDPRAVVHHQSVRGVIDWEEPVGLLMIAVLHFIDRAAANRIVADYRRRLAPGSWVAISAVTGDGDEADRRTQTVNADQAPTHLREAPVLHRPSAVQSWFDGLELLPPGLVTVPGSAQPGDPLHGLAGVARVPGAFASQR